MSMDTEGLVQIPLETIVSAKNVQDLREKFKEHVQRGARLMELDFSRVESIDSVGIGLLVATHNSLVKVGGNLSLVNLSQDIHKLLTLMRLDQHFSVSQADGGGGVMALEVNDLMQGFVEDCREHLDHIEALLMDIEAAGDNQDPEVVNSVFRAAHSIKGGAGMLGLDNIKALSHKLENVLHMVRSNEMAPTHDVVDVLLKGFDRLTEMVNNIEDSENLSIDAHVAKLVALTAKTSASADVSREPMKIDVGQSRIFTVDSLSLEQAKKGGNEIYLLEYDLIHDIHGKGKMPLEVLRPLMDTGRIVDCKVDFSAVGDLDGFGNSIPFYVLFATILEPMFICGLTTLPQERVRHIADAGDAVHVAPVTAFREEFGSVLLTIKDGVGRVITPKYVDAQALTNLRLAMLGAMPHCSRMVVDWGGVNQCDVFFFQLLCSAQHTYHAKGIRLSVEGVLDADLRQTAKTMGFGCDDIPACLFNAA